MSIDNVKSPERLPSEHDVNKLIGQMRMAIDEAHKKARPAFNRANVKAYLKGSKQFKQANLDKRLAERAKARNTEEFKAQWQQLQDILDVAHSQPDNRQMRYLKQHIHQTVKCVRETKLVKWDNLIVGARSSILGSLKQAAYVTLMLGSGVGAFHLLALSGLKLEIFDAANGVTHDDGGISSGGLDPTAAGGLFDLFGGLAF